ncbi:uncharacterized protein LOC135691963 [Rhopilema esculentum]|uniref:uncharacterized protein LOC135691963 n=1 Tax=Rhopilema esculentum TaxID=499914 RepID=UPI0031E41F3E
MLLSTLVIIFVTTFVFAVADGAVQKIEFTEEPKSLVALENENAIFRCSAVTVPPQRINYMWKKNDIYMDISKMPRAEITSSGSLVISSVKRSDFGSYRCIAQCTDGALISQQAKLEKPELSMAATQSTVQVKEGGYHIYDPHLKINTPVTVSWLLCSKSTTTCKSPDPSSTYVTSNGSLLMSPIMAADDTYYGKLEIRGKYTGTRQVVFGPINIIEYLPNHWKYKCPEATLNFLPTTTNFTVPEGGNVIMDCLAVLKRCANTLVFHWEDKAGRRRSETRQLKLSNVTKQDEGTYTCVVDTSGDPKAYFFLKVVGKPKIVNPPPEIFTLGSDGLVTSGDVENADLVEWYTNAERILEDTTIYQVRRDNRLLIKHHSRAFEGIYQIVYRNQAGALTRTVKVVVSYGACGERLNKNEGEISFAYPKDLQTSSIQCFWIIQSSSPSPLQFYFANFIFHGRCDTTFAFIYNGTVKMTVATGMHFCSNTPPKGLVSTHGPYVTVFVQGQKTDLDKGSFKLLYGPNITVPTTVPSTTSKSSRAPSTTASTASTKIATTTVTKKTKPNSQGTITNVISTTRTSIITATSKVRKTKKPKTTRTEAISTEYKKWSTSNTNATTVKPKKHRRNRSTSDDVTVAVAVSVTVVILIVILIIVFILYRKQKSQRNISKGSFFANKKTCANGRSNVSKDGRSQETCFTLRGNSDGGSTRKPFPDVIPRFDTKTNSRYASYNQNTSEDNYTALGAETATDNQTYSSLQFERDQSEDSLSQGHPYAVIVPEEEQYMPVANCDSISGNVIENQSVCSTMQPVYQELQKEHDSPSNNQGYHPSCVVANHAAFINSQPHLYEGAPQQPLYHVLEDKSVANPGLKGNVQIGQEYLQPQASIKPPRVSPKPRARKTVSEGHNNRNAEYATSHYIQPNPVNETFKKSYSQSQRYQKPNIDSVVSDSAIYMTACEGVNGEDRAAENDATAMKYQPITSDDAAYLAIMNGN